MGFQANGYGFLDGCGYAGCDAGEALTKAARAVDAAIAACTAMLPTWEAAISWMYLDTRGNVTTGLGFMLPTADLACALPFQFAGRAATAAEITADFNRVAAMEFGQHWAAGHYQAPSSPLLGAADMTQIAETKLEALAASLSSRLLWFAALPSPAQTALLDMTWNMGLGGLLKYHKMLAALAATPPDLAAAAADCIREAANPAFSARNLWCQKLFRDSMTG